MASPGLCHGTTSPDFKATRFSYFHSFHTALRAVIAGYSVVTGVNEREGDLLIVCMGRLFIPVAYKQVLLSKVLKEVIMTVGGSHRY